MPQSFRVDSLQTAILAALVLGVLNWTVKPILQILSLPITILTLGLFSLVINGIIISLLAYLVAGIEVSSLLVAILVAIIISLVNSILDSVSSDKRRR